MTPRLGRFVGVRVGVAYSRDKLALRSRLRYLSLIFFEISALIFTIF